MIRLAGAALLAALVVLGACGGDDDDDVGETTMETTPEDDAFDLGVQSELRNGLTAAKTIATDAGGRFVDAEGIPLDADDLAAVEPDVRFDRVVVEPEGASIVLVKVSESGTAFCIAATSDGAVTYGADEDPSNVDSIADCVDGSW
ncbi:MAG TPA: hypothetical protein VFU93_13725 [Acidimicrobiales bacterium]|nr:hypothetical protein [Acidimicrobiales bacterium]